MSLSQDETREFRDVLLGRQPASEPLSFDDDSRLQDGFDLVESNLIDEYLQGSLSAQDRIDFERSYMTGDAERLEKIDFARQVFRMASQERRRRVAGYCGSALLGALSICLVFWFSRQSHTQELALTQSQRGAQVAVLKLGETKALVLLKIDLQEVAGQNITASVTRIGSSGVVLQLELRA